MDGIRKIAIKSDNHNSISMTSPLKTLILSIDSISLSHIHIYSDSLNSTVSVVLGHIFFLFPQNHLLFFNLLALHFVL